MLLLGVRDFAEEIDTKLVVMQRQEKLQKESEAPTLDPVEQQKVLDKILKLIKKDDDVDDTLHEIMERGLNRLVRPFGGTHLFPFLFLLIFLMLFRLVFFFSFFVLLL